MPEYEAPKYEKVKCVTCNKKFPEYLVREENKGECTRCAMNTRRRSHGKCDAYIRHGAGHQSTTFCEGDLGHDGNHYCTYGQFDTYAEWKQKVGSSGMSDPTWSTQ